jgi:hypothetical protein
MRLLGWLKGSAARANGKLDAWRRDWGEAVAKPDAAALDRLRASLHVEPPLADDIEIEEEMLEGLERLLALTGDLADQRLPHLETTHRIVGADACHFSAPVSMPEDVAQPTGRLLLTGTRAVFAGGARPTTLAWHAAAEVVQAERDVLLIRADRATAYRFRCNNYGDALTAAAIARHLIARARGAARSRAL